MMRIYLTFLVAVVSLQAGFIDEFFTIKKGIKTYPNELYQEACGDCHFAYQPGWLPKRSWEKMMEPGELEDHFGDNAEMEEEDRLATLKYLLEHAAETSDYKRPKKTLASIKPTETPLRISETRYLKRKHSDIPEKLIKQKDVLSLAQCNKCHQHAKEGVFDDDDVKIPNYGRWDDW